jgi:hypothetical protein
LEPGLKRFQPGVLKHIKYPKPVEIAHPGDKVHLRRITDYSNQIKYLEQQKEI